MNVDRRAKNPPLSAFARVPEGRVFLIGAAATAAFLIGLVAATAARPADATRLWSLVVTRLVAGRAIGLYTGFLTDVDPFWIYALNVAVETIWILLFTPLVLLASRKALRLRWFESINDAKNEAIARYGHLLQRGLPVALFIFVFVPLPLTGPVLGSLIAAQFGMRLPVNLGIVILAANSALFAWGAVLSRTQNWAAEKGVAIQWLILSVVVAGLALWKLMNRSSAADVTDSLERSNRSRRSTDERPAE